MLKDRLELAFIGGVAGLSLWAFFEFLPEIVGQGWGLHFALSFATAFFAALMALVGPEKPQRALLPSAALALVVGVLALMGALRFATPVDFIANGYALVALSALMFIATPFAAAELEAKNGWRDYTRLFDTAWGIFIRYFAGWLFAGLILLVLYLSDELLKLVGIRLIGDLLDVDIIRYTLLGAMFGLGVATVHELRDYVSPVLVHRLLRMLVPLVLVVVVVFIGALPFRGLSDLFGRLSTAAVLMSVAFGAITLITTLIDRDDDNASEAKLMRLSARALALLLPCLVALAVYAIWLRVAEYGFTPDRVIAAYIALFLSAYALCYAYFALRGHGWQGKMRQSNLYIALAICVGAALWLTPLINAQALSAKSQLARFQAGETEADSLPLYQMAHEWGRPGAAALKELEASGDTALVALIAKAREASSVWAFGTETRETRSVDMRASLAGRIAIRPASAAVAPLLEDMTFYVLKELDKLCEKGPQPTCVIVMLPKAGRGFSKSEGLVFAQGNATAYDMARQGNSLVLRGMTAFGPDSSDVKMSQPRNMFDLVMKGEFALKPESRVLMNIGDVVLVPFQ